MVNFKHFVLNNFNSHKLIEYFNSLNKQNLKNIFKVYLIIFNSAAQINLLFYLYIGLIKINDILFMFILFLKIFLENYYLN